MKRIINLIFFLLLISTLSAQEKWSYELFYSIDNLSGDKFLGNSNQVGFTVNYTEYNYTAGINARRHLTNDISIFTGLGYSKQEMSKSLVCNVCDVLPFQDDQRYLQVPLGVSYQLLNGRLKPMLETGLLNNLLVASTTNDVLGSQNASGFYLGGFFGAQLGYQLSDHLGVTVGYRFTGSLTDVFESTFNYRSNNFSLGINIVPSLFKK